MFDKLKPAIPKQKSPVKSDSAIGLDIGNYAVKVCQLGFQDKQFKLTGFGYSQLDILNPKATVDAIKNVCSQARISSKKVNVSVFPDGVIIRYLLLPLMSDEELRKAMSFEIERYVPFSKEEVVSDYQILKVDEEKKNIKVLMVAAKKETVDSRAKLLQEAGLEPQVVTIDSMVLKNVFQENYAEKKNITVGLLNIGAKVTNINIIRDNYCYFMRDVQIGGENITNLLKEKFDLDTNLAEQKKSLLNPGDQEAFKIIEPVLGNLLNEIYLSFDYYESEFGLVVEEVYLSGGTANLNWLADFFKENLGRQISVLNPFKNIAIDHSIDPQKVANLATSLTVPVGLALEAFN
ncbi:MAG: type IV pilus assembly protein PilM [Candidatus Omnitrophota bacterium]|nr:type IV pilus assembly protein PilM [Candidatus Omnitrophota bacterium]